MLVWFAVVVNYFGAREYRLIDPMEYGLADNTVDGLHGTPEWNGLFGADVHDYVQAWENES